MNACGFVVIAGNEYALKHVKDQNCAQPGINFAEKEISEQKKLGDLKGYEAKFILATARFLHR